MCVRVFALLPLMAALLFPCIARAAVASADDQWTANFFFENDLFGNTDRNYTNGVRASLVSPDLSDFHDEAGNSYPLIDRLNRFLSPLHPDAPRGEMPLLNLVASVGQLMFTPADRSRTTVDPDDRPYAGWLYIGLGYHARTNRKLNSVEFNLGVVGPAALARQTQNFFHELNGVEKFRGWDNQLRNEPGLRLVFEQKQRLFDYTLPVGTNLKLDFISHWGASLGNIATYANIGGEWRIGYNLPEDFGTSTLKPGGDNSTPGRGDINTRPFQIQAFLAVDARAVLHSIFLDGNTFSNSHSVDKERYVADVAAGMAVVRGRWRLSYAHVYRTREFRTQEQSQKYGALSLSYSYPW